VRAAASIPHQHQRYFTSRLAPLPVPPQGGQSEVVAALLPFPHHGTFAPKVEVHLGQLEPVGGTDDGPEALLGLGRRGPTHKEAPAWMVAPTNTSP